MPIRVYRKKDVKLFMTDKVMDVMDVHVMDVISFLCTD